MRLAQWWPKANENLSAFARLAMCQASTLWLHVAPSSEPEHCRSMAALCRTLWQTEFAAPHTFGFVSRPHDQFGPRGGQLRDASTTGPSKFAKERPEVGAGVVRNFVPTRALTPLIAPRLGAMHAL